MIFISIFAALLEKKMIINPNILSLILILGLIGVTG
jgi:hypothetical protein